MSNMTEEQIKSYLISPNICPFCESNDIEASGYDISGNNVVQDIACLHCDETWIDEFTLTGVI